MIASNIMCRGKITPPFLFRVAKSSCAIAMAVTLAACAGTERESPFTGWFAPYENCREQYAELDARVDAAGVRDSSFYRVPGYPYLRTDRTLASFRHEVSGLNDVAEWVRRMRELDLEARHNESANLGLSEAEAEGLRDRFLNCGRILATFELQDPEAWDELTRVVYPPDAYSTVRRTLGLYPLLAPRLASKVEQRHAELLRRDSEVSNGKVASQAQLKTWRVESKEDLELLNDLRQANQINSLGYPGLTGSQWSALAERHAPRLSIETEGDFDIPASPRFTGQGLEADPSQPAVYYQFGFTRVQKQVLVQIVYSLWFQAAPSMPNKPIDGMIWRVTLDEQFEPLLYESVDASGADHRLYPVDNLVARREIEDEVPLIVPASPDPILRLEARSHTPSVQSLSSGALDTAQRYALVPYESLYTLPLPGGGTRSLFDPDGLVVESRGSAPIGGLASGIVEPGTLRHVGHLAVAHLGRRHFDDPYLIESLFTVKATSASGAITGIASAPPR